MEDTTQLFMPSAMRWTVSTDRQNLLTHSGRHRQLVALPVVYIARYCVSIILHCATDDGVRLKPGFHSNATLTLRALRKRKPQEMQALAFEWKPSFTLS